MKRKRIRPIPIRTSTDNKNIIISGWYHGKCTYLWLGIQNKATGYGKYLDTISGGKLYRLAKSIVRHFDREVGNDKGNH